MSYVIVATENTKKVVPDLIGRSCEILFRGIGRNKMTVLTTNADLQLITVTLHDNDVAEVEDGENTP